MDRSRHPPPYGLPPGPPQPQQPSFDPFQRRDPFLPTPQQEKREEPLSSPSYRPGDGLGSLPRPIDFPLKDVLQNSHPQPPSPFHGSGSVFRDEHLRRRSLGGGYQGGPIDHSGQHQQHQPPPPPQHSSSYASRHSGPQGSSPVQSNGSPYATSSPHTKLPAPQPPTSRDEPPRPYLSHRPSTSMSISSIMGSDHPTLPQPTHPPLQPPSSYSQGGSSWTRSPLAAVPDISRRPRTPDRFPLNRGSYPNSGISSPEQHRARPGETHRPPFGVASPTSSSMPPRPFSQPSTQENSFGSQPDPRREEDQYGHPHLARPLDQDRADRELRDREASDRRGPRAIMSNPDPDAYYGPYGAWRAKVAGYMMVPHDPKRDPGGPQTPIGPLEALNRERQRHTSSQAPPPEPSPGDVRAEQQAADAPGRSTPKSGGAETFLRKSIEDAQGFAPRSIFNSDFAQRFDRGSPLPQAVQGVSAQPVGIGRDPGIKNEFKRIFSGLGSGVGGTPPNGTGTPGRGTPARDERDGESHGGQAPASSNKRGRKAYEAVFESDSGDGRSSPIPGRASTKKAKAQQQQQTPATHHHHHHLPHTHHHHHHHRKQDGEPPGPLNRTSSYTPFNSLKHGSPTSQPNGTPAGAASAVPHHHHHHGPHHHHHHHHPPTQPTAPPPVPLRRPLTTIKTRPLLESIAHLPRKHLGSQLYAPEVCAPPLSHPTPSDPRDAVSSKVNTIPRFEGKENCTYTIRITRTFLTETYRELLCRDRRIWGTDVYTDDSDPLTAAIHSGWILGAWPKDVDISLLDLKVNPASAKAASDSALRSSQRREVVSAPPDDGPLTPPKERDLHLTVLILPPLQKYASSVWHGVKSRSWGDNHDGMSFKIERLEWVDEGVVGRMRGRDAKSWKAGINESKSVDDSYSTSAKKSKTTVNGNTNGTVGSNGIPKDQPGAPLRGGAKSKGTPVVKASKASRAVV